MQGIDSIMYCITDQRHTNAMIAAVARGVPVRLISEPDQYRSEGKQWHSWNIDRMYMAGVQIKHRLHAGQSHEKLTILHRSSAAPILPMTILGSSNWTSASDYNAQHEHNWFTSKAWVHNWSVEHFNRKWNNTGPVAETTAFVPLPPNTPLNRRPANSATGQPTSVTLEWYAGFWAHKYDVYLDTSPNPTIKILSDVELGPSTSKSNNKKLVVHNLLPGTTYYWKVTGRTMANIERTGGTWSFTTAGGITSPTCGALPSGWSSADIGGVASTGASCYGGSTFAVTGSGADVWGAADEFRFTYRSMTGDGSITARVATLQNIDPWTKSGVMMREKLAAGSAHAAMFVSPTKGLAFQRRTTTGGATTSTGTAGTSPKFVRITRAGNRFTAAWSDSGAACTTVGSQTIAMGATIQVGIPITSHRDGTLASATVDTVSVATGGGPEPPACGSLPSGWAAADIGAVSGAGTACYSSATSIFTVEGAGADVWGTADELHFVYRQLTGDGTITARVASIENVDPWTKSGVMIRASLSASSAHGSIFVSPGKGVAFQRRTADGGLSTSTAGGPGTAPRWVRVQRIGDSVVASTSLDNVIWEHVGTDTIALGASVYVGIAVTSHRDGVLATAAVGSVAVE